MSVRSDRFFDKARAHLAPGEQVRAGVFGARETVIAGGNSVREGVLLATDRRLLFYAKKIGGYELESFPYDTITSFEQGRNLMGHHLRLTAAGNALHLKWVKDAAAIAEFAAAVHAALRPAPPT